MHKTSHWSITGPHWLCDASHVTGSVRGRSVIMFSYIFLGTSLDAAEQANTEALTHEAQLKN